MSYEGYEQFICGNGHYYEVDAMGLMHGGDDEDVCDETDCGLKPVWSNSVDCTNGDGDIYRIEMEEYIKTKAVYETCPHCKHSKLIKDDVYNIPPEGAGKRI